MNSRAAEKVVHTAGRPGNALAAGAAVASARAASLVAAAVQLPVLTRLLEPGDYGRLAVAIAVATYISVFTDVHTLAFQRFPGSLRERLNYAYASRRVYGTLAVVAVVLVAGGYVFGSSWTYGLAIAGWGFGLAASRLVATAWLGWLRPWAYAGSLATSTAVRTVTLVGLVVLTGDADVSLAVAGLACGAAALLTGPRHNHRGAGRSGVPWRLSFGIQLAVASAAITLMANSVLLVLPAFEAPGAVGRFAAMHQLASLTSGAALGLLTTVAYPRLRHAWDAGRHRDVYSSLVDTALLIVGAAAAALALLSAGDYWLARLAVAGDLHDFRLVPTLIVATAIASLATTTSWEHQLRLDVAMLSRRTLAAAVVGVAALVALTMAFGLEGAAFGVVVLQAVYVLLVTPGAARPAQRSTATVALALIGLVALATEPSPTAITVSGAAVAAAVGAVLVGRRRRARHL